MALDSILLLIHILMGVISLFTGLVSIVARKRKGAHTMAGEIYHAAYLLLFITSIWLAVRNWGESAYLFYIAVFSYGWAVYGYLARKRRWRNWLDHHIRGMMGSYIGLITAVLVVNGGNIPLINRLPAMFYWFLPTLILSPVVYWLARNFKRKGSPQKARG